MLNYTGSGNSLVQDEYCPDCGRSLAPGERCVCEKEQCPNCGEDIFRDEGCEWCGWEPGDKDE